MAFQNMADLIGCEKYVVEKLISAFSKSLNCYPTGSNDSDVLVLEKVLQVLLSQNESLFTNDDGSNNSGGLRSISENQEFINSTNNVILVFNDVDSPPKSDDQGGLMGGTNKLHQLEIIKVFVLIFVISIILLTTCRMVFQLFIRFRPEKPPLA